LVSQNYRDIQKRQFHILYQVDTEQKSEAELEQDLVEHQLVGGGLPSVEVMQRESDLQDRKEVQRNVDQLDCTPVEGQHLFGVIWLKGLKVEVTLSHFEAVLEELGLQLVVQRDAIDVVELLFLDLDFIEQDVQQQRVQIVGHITPR